MQIRCYNCHRPFALSQAVVHSALDHVTVAGLSHYNAYCPHCKRANRISVEELHRAAPNWEPQSAEEESAAE